MNLRKHVAKIVLGLSCTFPVFASAGIIELSVPWACRFARFRLVLISELQAFNVRQYREKLLAGIC